MDQPATDNPTDTPAPASTQGVSYGFLSVAMVIIFILGLAVGFLGRPAMVGDSYVEVVVTATPDPDSQAVAQSQPVGATEPESSNSGAPTPTIMDFVLSDARHFQGSADAPVTIVEFSDFK